MVAGAPAGCAISAVCTAGGDSGGLTLGPPGVSSLLSSGGLRFPSSQRVSLPTSPQVLPPSLCPLESELSSPPLSRRPAKRSAPPSARPCPPPMRPGRAAGPAPRAADPQSRAPTRLPSAPARGGRLHSPCGRGRGLRALCPHSSGGSSLAARHLPRPRGCLLSCGGRGLGKRGGVRARERRRGN